MLQKYNKKIALFSLIFIILSTLTNCAKENADDNPLNKKKRINPNVEERAREAADRGGDILSKMRKNNATTFEFGTSNVLWRATLKSLDFMPLLAVDYAGGVIVTDWYGNNLNTTNKVVTEELKMTIRFLSNELSIASIDIKSFKKKCIQNNCSTLPGDQKLNNELKSEIIKKAREISIEDEKAKNNKKK